MLSAATDRVLLRGVVIAAGLGWALAFIVIEFGARLQLYGDGAMFSYAVAAQDVWAFHWHNISGRLTTYLLTMAPAEGVAGVTRSSVAAVMAYGLLLYLMPLVGLAATYAADRSQRCVIFVFACASTAALCPLVFGFPTEMWLAHAWFWPALAAAHYAQRGARGSAAVFATLLALVFSHEGGFVLAGTILATLMLRGFHNGAFRRAARAFAAVVVLWIAVKAIFPPGPYYADVYLRAALGFFDAALLRDPLLILIGIVLAGYALTCAALSRVTARAPVYAFLIVLGFLSVYWLGFDGSLHASNRYYMRTLLVVLTPLFGISAALLALEADGRLLLARPLLARAIAAMRCVPPRVIVGIFVLVTLIHAVETTKFVAAWTDYKAAVLRLATGPAADPELGDPRFVSSDRIESKLNRLSWFSTTPYLSAVLADFAPARLVIDPSSTYFWLSCATATENLNAAHVVPRDVRMLVRTYSCEHR